jgi:hypothetical protein
MTIRSFRRLAAVAAVAATLPACAGGNLGALGDILGGVLGAPGGAQQGQQGQVLAEVQSVDTRQQVIQVRTDQGQTGAVHFDQNTVVVYRQQQYPVTALERGDVVAMQVQQASQNRLYTPRIDVQQSVQERTGQAGGGVAGQVQQLTGRVGQIDHQRGAFQLQTQQGTVVVTLRYNPGAAITDRFHRLRTGETVRIEGAFTGDGRVELYRFV